MQFVVFGSDAETTDATSLTPPNSEVHMRLFFEQN